MASRSYIFIRSTPGSSLSGYVLGFIKPNLLKYGLSTAQCIVAYRSFLKIDFMQLHPIK